MGLLSKAFGTYTVTGFISKQIRNAVKDTEFGKAVFGFTDNVKEQVADKINHVVSGALSDYASHIEKDKWDSIAAESGYTSAGSEEEARLKSLSGQFLDAVSKEDAEKWSELGASINENPGAWGYYLEQKGVSEEKLAEMQEQGVSGYDLVKLTFGMQVSEVKEEPEKTAETEQQYNQAVSVLGSAASGENEAPSAEEKTM